MSLPDSTPAHPPPRKRRFQFSLRTLLIVVFIYGGLWLLTIKWGANQITGETKAFVTAFNPDVKFIDRGDSGFSWSNGDSYTHANFELTVFSPIPFIIVVDSTITDSWSTSSRRDSRTVYLWFFGWGKILSDNSDRPRKK